MLNLQSYINFLNTIYAHKYISLINNSGEIVYITPNILELYELTEAPKYLHEIPNKYANLVHKIEEINLRILNKQITVAHFILTTLTKNQQPRIFQGTKNLVNISNDEFIITIFEDYEYLSNIEHLLPMSNNDSNKCIRFRRIEQYILFVLSLGFSIGESYKYIIETFLPDLTYTNFRYYCNRIQQKLKLESVDEIRDQLNTLHYSQYIPVELIHNNIFLVNT